jgi:hypothetical protein
VSDETPTPDDSPAGRWKKPGPSVDMLPALGTLVHGSLGRLPRALLDRIGDLPLDRRSTFGDRDSISDLVESAAMLLLDTQRIRAEIGAQLGELHHEDRAWGQLSALVGLEVIAMRSVNDAVVFYEAMES